MPPLSRPKLRWPAASAVELQGFVDTGQCILLAKERELDAVKRSKKTLNRPDTPKKSEGAFGGVRIIKNSKDFIDDKLENVFAARSFGMHGVVFNDKAKSIQLLRSLGWPYSVARENFSSPHEKCVNIREQHQNFRCNYVFISVTDTS